MCSVNPHLTRSGFQRAPRSLSYDSSSRAAIYSVALRSKSLAKSCRVEILHPRCNIRRRFTFPIAVMDDDSVDIPSFFEEGDEISGDIASYVWSSSEGEESDTDLLVSLPPDVDLPMRRELTETHDAAVTVTVHRLATLQKGQRNNRTQAGLMIIMGLIVFLASFLIFFDWCSWKIVRLPLEPFYLTRPFSIAAILSAFAGCVFVPILDSMKFHQTLRKISPLKYSSNRATPTMGGLFFIPIGVAVARGLAGVHSIQVYGAVMATFALGAIGLLGDILSFRKDHNYGLSRWMKFFLQLGTATWFSFWLDSTEILTPYSMKLLVPLPPPFGLVYLGRFYLVLTAFCFVSVGNGVRLIDGSDGLAGGSAALAFVGMSVAVLAICPDLSIFGASMAGACIGFLFHSRYKSSIYMGEIGSLALGGALVAMAACTGMFLPLFISSGVFLLELLSVVVQVLYMVMAVRHKYQAARRFIRMAPLHQHLRLYVGLRGPLLVGVVYIVSFGLSLAAGYVGLISA